jgi:hypothetical protein
MAQAYVGVRHPRFARGKQCGASSAARLLRLVQSGSLENASALRSGCRQQCDLPSRHPTGGSDDEGPRQRISQVLMDG